MVPIDNASHGQLENKRVWSQVEDEWTLLVPARQNLDAQVDRHGPASDLDCSFCFGGREFNDASTSPRAVPSKHPMIQVSGDVNAHFVIVYGMDHAYRLGEVSLPVACDFLELIGVLTERMFLSQDVLSVYAFESVGDHFGPTVSHPHGQVLGLPFIPRRLLLGGTACQICIGEYDGALTVIANDVAELLVSPWARVPFDLIVRPKRHVSRVAFLTTDELRAMVCLVRLGLSLCTKRYGSRPPYILSVMQGPRSRDDHHLRIEIMSLHKGANSLKRPGALEIGLGVYVNPVTPEHAAQVLRDDLRSW